MVKKKPTKKPPVIAIISIAFGVALLAYVIYVASLLYQAVSDGIDKDNRVVVNLTSLGCDDTKVSKECQLVFTLRNDNDTYIVPDLNGINGPGFAESGVKSVTALLDDGTKKDLFASDDFYLPGRVEPHETRRYQATFTIDSERTIKSITVLGTTFTFKP
ncbi:MAG: hypothetical protein WAO28_00930 [Candidatus Microsaccharimonas sp.]